MLSGDGDPGQNYLCPGLKLFFTHTRRVMQTMAQLLRRRRPPSDVIALTTNEDARRGPYRPCPCSSGRKFRFCHGDKAAASSFGGVTPARPSREVAAPGSELLTTR